MRVAQAMRQVWSVQGEHTYTYFSHLPGEDGERGAVGLKYAAGLSHADPLLPTAWMVIAGFSLGSDP